MLVGLMIAAAAPAAQDFHAWARFSRQPARARRSETVEIATAGVDAASGRLRFTMRLTQTRLDEPPFVATTDSTRCPSVAETVRAMRTLAVPRIAPPGDDVGDVVVVADGTTYSFEGPASGSNARLSFSTNVGTPLAAWIDARLTALASCWTPEKP